MKELVGLRAKTYRYLHEWWRWKSKRQKHCIIKKLKFEDHKNCLETAQTENKIIHLEKGIDADTLKEDHKEFIKNNKLILKT